MSISMITITELTVRRTRLIISTARQNFFITHMPHLLERLLYTKLDQRGVKCFECLFRRQSTILCTLHPLLEDRLKQLVQLNSLLRVRTW